MKRLLYDAWAVTMLFAMATAAVSAKTINLYLEPKTDSKVASTINTETGVTIVYTPKSSEWIKVADPSNGNVGWIKSSDLGSNGYSNMRVFTSDDGTYNYQVYQFDTGNGSFNHKQLEDEIQHFEQQQHIMRVHMAHMFNDMVYFPQPVFVPVIMVPEQLKPEKSSSAKVPHIKSNSSSNSISQ